MVSRQCVQLSQPNFIDLFAGCGGLSLGLSKAGWQGIFSVEKSPDAFATFNHNFCENRTNYEFEWPDWLPCQAMTTSDLLESHTGNLLRLRGKIDLIAGGPPCQGFSMAGLRNPEDPRNQLTDEYIDIVNLIQPKFLILENVKGFQHAFPDEHESHSEKVIAKLNESAQSGYQVFSKLLDAAKFGVPQTRKRFIMIAVRRDLDTLAGNPIEQIEKANSEFCESRGLNDTATTAENAISDLEIRGVGPNNHSENGRFKKITYTGRRELTSFQKLMRQGVDRRFEPNSLRLANHTQKVADRFQRILRECPHGIPISQENREKYKLKKQCFTPLHRNKLASTVTTLPDDMIHYCEPRILTVRENARLQSFPDWFEFLGKYTTGGQRRKQECPRYSQVGNAVPPLLAEAIGEVLMKMSGP